MVTLESPKAVLGLSVEEAIAFASDPSQLGELLPEGQVSGFEATDDGCSFKVSGGLKVILLRTNIEAGNHVRYTSQKGTPIKFHLDVVARDRGNGRSEVQVICEADLNPFTRMMAEKPLNQLFAHIVSVLSERFPAD